MSINPDNMQSGNVSGDNVVVNELDGDAVNGKTLPESLVPDSGGGGGGGEEEEKSLEEEEEDENVEVEFVGKSELRPGIGGSESLIEGRESMSLEGEKGSVNVEGNGIGESGSKTVSEECEGGRSSGATDVALEIGGDKGGTDQANFNVSALQLFPKAVANAGISKEAEAAVIEGNVVTVGTTATEVEMQVAGAAELSDSKAEYESKTLGSNTDSGKGNTESGGVHVAEGGFSDTKSVNLVADTDSSGKSIGKKRKGKGDFRVSDLVWGKVRSHPWWAAQIFNPEDASNQAKKHSKSKSYLVAYFGDKTFAWNDEATLKPFTLHFSQMVKQSTMEAFRHAVNCALDEVARRVEFGLSCNCTLDYVYSRLKTQVVENAGIREKSSIREGRDRFYTASSFEPIRFLEYVKDLAQNPHVEEVDRLEYVTSRAQMSAFYRWKGCYHLAEFGPLKGYVNNEADAPINREKDEMHKMMDDVTEAPQINEPDNRPQKRKNSSGDIGFATKKVRHASDSLKKGKRKHDDDDDEVEAATKSWSPSVGRRKEAKLSYSASTPKKSRPQSTPSADSKTSFSIGESILRVADQLSQPSPLLKLDSSSDGKTNKAKGKSKQSVKKAESRASEKSSPDVIFSQLILAAVEPVKEHSLLSCMITFLSDFRNSVVQETELMLELEEFAGEDIDGKSHERPSWSGSEQKAEGSSPCMKCMEKTSDSEITRTSSIEAAENACCNEKVTTELKRPTCLTAEKMAPVELERAKTNGLSVASLAREGSISGDQQHVNSEGGQSTQEQQAESPTSLTLKFTDTDSIPSEANLNEIFSAFGPLKEAETEVLSKKNWARVVFKRHVDAEAAFSSSGKFELFGVSLVSYWLGNMPSPRKSSPVGAKRRRNDGKAA